MPGAEASVLRPLLPDGGGKADHGDHPHHQRGAHHAPTEITVGGAAAGFAQNQELKHADNIKNQREPKERIRLSPTAKRDQHIDRESLNKQRIDRDVFELVQ